MTLHRAIMISLVWVIIAIWASILGIVLVYALVGPQMGWAGGLLGLAGAVGISTPFFEGAAK